MSKMTLFGLQKIRPTDNKKKLLNLFMFMIHAGIRTKNNY